MSAAVEPGRTEERDSAGKITLPPPEWSAPRGHDEKVRVVAPPPLLRRLGAAPAMQGALRAELRAAHAARDTARERSAASRLARWLAAQGRSWDDAVRYARRALDLGEDESLRHELSGWLEGLGSADRAAEVLEPLATAATRDPVEAVRLLLHTGVLHARAGDARAAASAFARASRIDATEALASELFGTIASWAPSAVAPAEAAESYVEAAARRSMASAFDAQMEDLLRAFDVDPTSSVAVAALALALTERGRPLGADEVWRAHATLLRPHDDKRSRAVHARRRLQARAAGDLARALGAALDEGLDTVFGADVGDFMDDLLLRAGLVEPLVARLEMRAEAAPPPTRAALFEEVARLYEGALANRDAAAAARIRAVAADPMRDDTLTALRAYATETRDATELVEALVRAATAGEESVSEAVRRSAARALAAIAGESLADPSLAVWARQKATEGTTDEGISEPERDALAALAAEVRRVEAALETERDGEERVELLRRLATLLRSCPDEAELDGRALAELAERLPAERRWYAEAVRLAVRRSDHAEVIRLARAVRERPGASTHDVVDAAVTEAAARRALGDLSGANETTRTLLSRAADDPRALSVAWMNASLAGDRETRSSAIEQLAKFAGASVRAVLYAVAAEARAAIGDRDGSRRLAERACYTDPSSARAVGTLADAAVGGHDRAAASALERGIHFLFARSGWCRGLAEALDAMGESSHAVGWTQRLVALRPGDRKAMAVLLERVARTRDAARLSEALSWVLSQPQPAPVLAELAVPPLRDLIAFDATRAASVARRALDAFGAGIPGLREAILAAADAAGDAALATTTLERAAGLGDERTRDAALGLLFARYRDAGDFDGLARTLLGMARFTPAAAVVEALDELAASGAALSEDAELARLEATALAGTAMAAVSPDETPDAIAAWREFAAAAWDLAGDQEGAEHALWRAAKLDPRSGFTTLAFDLAALGGPEFALDVLDQRIDDESSDARAAMMAAQTARVALALGIPSRALDFAVTALARSPKMAEALEIAESAGVASGREVELTRVYDDLTVRALGRFARRAVNYRAARFFEQQGDDGLALKHAARAFQAVPSEGAALILLLRTSERAGDRAQAVDALVQVAETVRDKGSRFGWLLRAASATGEGEQGLALRVNVLLHALTVSRDPRASQLLRDTAEELLRVAPDERASLEVRLARASKAVTAKADGPEGARLSVTFARIALDLFGDARWGSEALASALSADGDLDEYANLDAHAPTLARGGDVEPLFAFALRPYANLGVAAFRLLAHVAEAMKDWPRAADLWSRAAAKEPDDAALVRAADAVLREHGDDASWARFRKACPDGERARVFHDFAAERLRDGAIDEALRALERATELASAEDKPAIERELRGAYEASGHAEKVEQRSLAQAMDASATVEVRARRWLEVGQFRETRGDLPGATEALGTATSLDPNLVAAWETLERVAAAAEREDLRVAALRQVVDRQGPSDRAPALKRLARALESKDEFREAEAVWRKVAEAAPDDEDADQAIEALISALRDYAELALHLERRTRRLAKSPGAREALRAVRIRRAAILEQRLGRTRDACAELALVLEESPDNVSALSYLADLHERLGEFGSAAPIWQRVALLSRDPSVQTELELRAGRAAFEARDYRPSLACAKEILAREPGRRDALELRASSARALREDEDLCDALTELVATDALEPHLASEALVEASYAATRLGRDDVALDRARQAADVTPYRAAAQVLARTLEYRQRGAGTPDEAATTLAQLDSIADELTAPDIATVAFLRAEAVDVLPGGGGLATLRECLSSIGPHPLLSLGIAERLAAAGEHAAALDEFNAALAADLGGFRDRGPVALEAAECAVKAGRLEAAISLFQDAAASEASRTVALLRAADVVAGRGDAGRARGILEELAATGADDDRARALGQLARLERASDEAGSRDRALDAFERAIAAATPGSALANQLVADRDAVTAPPASVARPAVSLLEAPAFALAGPASIRTAPLDVEGSAAFTAAFSAAFESPRRSSRPPPVPLPALPVLSPLAPPPPPAIAELEHVLASASGREQRIAARLALSRAHLAAGSQEAAYACLEGGLEEGGQEEGDVLAALYEAASRPTDVVRVRQRLLALAPGDFGRLEALRAAASADRNLPYTRALDHVVRAFDPSATPLEAPPLAAQVPLPGFLGFLTRPAEGPVAQALSLVWEDGHSVWAKDAAAALQGASAIGPGAEASRSYEAAVSLLGLPRMPLFLRPSIDPPSAAIAMTWPPSVVLIGRVSSDGPELRYALGQALARSLPSCILTLGLPGSDAWTVFRALMGAFGPPESSRTMNKESGRLAEALWHVLPPRTQRRLQVLLGQVTLEGFEAQPGQALQAAHRVGLYLSGDLPTAVEGALAATRDPRAGRTLRGDDWMALCHENAAVADLFRLAVSSEYAEARWHAPVQPVATAPMSRRFAT